MRSVAPYSRDSPTYSDTYNRQRRHYAWQMVATLNHMDDGWATLVLADAQSVRHSRFSPAGKDGPFYLGNHYCRNSRPYTTTSETPCTYHTTVHGLHCPTNVGKWIQTRNIMGGLKHPPRGKFNRLPL